MSSTTRTVQKKPRKPPACDECKARRVLCHPQPFGAPCHRCVAKNVICTTTSVRRGRPVKNTESAPRATEVVVSQQPSQSSPSSMFLVFPQIYWDELPELPDLTPELVAHLFDCFDLLHPVNHPILNAASIKPAIQAVSFQLPLLTPELRVLALCIVALSSLISFHEAILGPGPCPESFSDVLFFSSPLDVRNCGRRRAPVCRALHAAALKAAWNIGIILRVSDENAASCFLLDLLEQTEFSGLSRPWASAHLSHLRAIPRSRNSAKPRESAHWGAFLMIEALISTRSRKPVNVTQQDQLLFCGHEPCSTEDFLASLEAAGRLGADVLYQAMRPFTFHITRLARQLWTTIIGDHVRHKPLSESAVIQFLCSLSLVHAALSHLLARADNILAASATPLPPKWSYLLGNATEDMIVRRCAYGATMGFIGLVLPLYNELQLRADANDAPAHVRNRMCLLRMQACQMVGVAVRELARAIRYLPTVHFDPTQRDTLLGYAQFALNEAMATPLVEPERVRDLTTYVCLAFRWHCSHCRIGFWVR
ncbi:hypothetical protein B0H19DRAFT_1175442 [Mycena capillaripes]|nr:hypothetical protein B0H19DRAFT_1175442 [Mycena capillaripes]